jgi:FAD/FMN-containing dehydrogenase
MTDLRSGLLSIVGPRGLLEGDDVAGRSCDPFRMVPPGGEIIVRPATTLEMSEVLKLCHALRQKVVTHGGRTGVAGGAYCAADEIIVSLERMAAVTEICPVTQVAEVEAGVPLATVQERAAEYDLIYPIDLGSKGSATIGGTIATNAGGNRVIRWGMTRSNVLGVEAVLADGTIVSAMNRLVKNNTGYDLKHLLIGSEGTIGIVTRAILRLVPAPTSQCVAFIAVADHDALLALLNRARRLMTLSAFEVMWPDYYDLVIRYDPTRRPVAAGQGAYVLVEAMGYEEAIDRALFDAFLEGAYADGLIVDAVLAASHQQVLDLWRVREAADIIVQAMSPFVSFDVSIDVRLVESFAREAKDALRSRFPALQTATFGHLGDNNIHIAACVGPDTLRHEQEIEAIVFGVLRRYGGAITAEHGIGQAKRAFLCEHRTPGEMVMMKRFRSGLDPLGLLNHDVMF